MNQKNFVSYTGAVEFKVVALRECPLPKELHSCEHATNAVDYWKLHVESSDYFNPECECLVALLVNTRMRIKGHQIISIGLMNQVLTHPREIFRAAIVASAFGIVLMHNHPSGDPMPSAEDLRFTKDLVQIGELLKIAVLDHVIVGNERFVSFRELGYLAK